MQDIDQNGLDGWGRKVITTKDLVELMYNDIDFDNLNIISDKKTEQYNKWCEFFNKKHAMIPPLTFPTHTPEEEHARRVKEWFIPQKYSSLDIRKTLLDLCVRDDERERVNIEMDMFEERDLTPLLQLMFAMVDFFRKEGIVWGVGRGSSCASYCLFLIGVHKVDSLLYDLDIKEFLK